jgi:hypothetical protein
MPDRGRTGREPTAAARILVRASTAAFVGAVAWTGDWLAGGSRPQALAAGLTVGVLALLAYLPKPQAPPAQPPAGPSDQLASFAQAALCLASTWDGDAVYDDRLTRQGLAAAPAPGDVRRQCAAQLRDAVKQYGPGVEASTVRLDGRR